MEQIQTQIQPHRSEPEESGLRQTILNESRHLLTTHGYDSLSMRKIAKRIGYSATSIYLHFENKESLFHALIEEGLERMYSFLQNAIDRSADPLVRLQALCRSYIEFGLSNPEYYEVMFVMKPVVTHRFPQTKYRRGRRNLELFSEALRDAKGLPTDSAEDFMARATQIWASLHGVVSLSIAERIDRRIDLQNLITETVENAVHSVTGCSLTADNRSQG